MKKIKQIIVMGVVASMAIGGMPIEQGYAMEVEPVTEIIDEAGDKWTDISIAINRWPLNTFNLMLISEYDFEMNEISVVFNGIKKDLETGETVNWEADELMVAWQKNREMLETDEFIRLFSEEVPDKYLPFAHLKFDEPLKSGVELSVDSSLIATNIMDYFYSKRLAFMMKNNEGDSTRADYNSYFRCALDAMEGQVCRLFYRDPIPGGGASSGLTKYFLVQKREVGGEVVSIPDGSLEESEVNNQSNEDITDESGGGRIDEATLRVNDDVADSDTENDFYDIKTGENMPLTSKNDEKYSSGDIFDEIALVVNSDGDNGGGSGLSNVMGISDEASMALIGKAESNKNGEGEIEVPRLGATAKQIDYKWLFLPILGLILVVYWWFFVPISKKREKSAKKSKKSVDNI